MQNREWKNLYIRSGTAGITHTKKLCGFISTVVPQKNLFGGRGRKDVNQQKHTKNLKFKFDKKSC